MNYEMQNAASIAVAMHSVGWASLCLFATTARGDGKPYKCHMRIIISEKFSPCSYSCPQPTCIMGSGDETILSPGPNVHLHAACSLRNNKNTASS